MAAAAPSKFLILSLKGMTKQKNRINNCFQPLCQTYVSFFPLPGDIKK